MTATEYAKIGGVKKSFLFTRAKRIESPPSVYGCCSSRQQSAQFFHSYVYRFMSVLRPVPHGNDDYNDPTKQNGEVHTASIIKKIEYSVGSCINYGLISPRERGRNGGITLHN
jgi:hypothetical protein